MNAPISTAGLLTLPLAELDADGPFQQRRTKAAEAADAGLAESIRRLGVLQPILVRWDSVTQQHQVVAGHRRVAAARAAGLETIRAVLVEGDEGTAMAAGIAENHQRAALAPIDLWRAMVHLQDVGWTIDGAAMALGIPMRLARRLDRLGRLHPDMIAAIEADEMPEEDDLAVIAGAPLEVQEAALRNPKNWQKIGKDKREPYWWNMAAACRVGRIAQRHALFDAAASGLVWEEDLFAQPDDKDAITTRDVKGFLEHQVDALRAKALRSKKLHLAEWDRKLGGPRLPSGWTRCFEAKALGAERYAAVIPEGPRAGEVMEIYATPPAPPPAKKGAAAKEPEKSSAPKPQESAPDSAPVDDNADGAEEIVQEEPDDETPIGTAPAPEPPPTKGRGPLTEKGRILVAQAKTTAIRCALRDRRDHQAETLLTVLVLAIAGDNVTVLGDPASRYSRTRFVDLAGRLVQPDGTPRKDVPDSEILAIAAEAAARMIVCAPTGAQGNESGAAAEWIGVALEAQLDMPRLDTAEILATATGDTLRAAAREAGLPVGGSSKVLRDRLTGSAEAMRLPGSAFGAAGPPEVLARPEGHVGPFPCIKCSAPDYCIDACACEADEAGGEGE